MKIFVSSTVVDLLDVRSEIFQLLTEMGASVYLSEFPTSEFSVDFQKSAVETCLANVSDSDYVILVIDKRYGVTLEKAGYGSISTTHLEYKTAKKLGKSILMLVRDKTVGEYNVYTKSPKDFSGFHVLATELAIFDLISEHSRLESKTKNNWLFQFQNSVDLKKILRKQLRMPLVKSDIARNISNGTIPILHCSAESEHIKHSVRLQFLIKCNIENLSSLACFDLRMQWGDEDKKHTEEIFAPGRKTFMSSAVSFDAPQGELVKRLLLSYKSWDGLRSSEIYEMTFKLRVFEGTWTYSTHLQTIERKFGIEDAVEINVE